MTTKVQKRRSVGLNRAIYEDLKRYCKCIDVPMSQFVENVVVTAMRHGHKPKRINHSPSNQHGIGGVHEV